MFDTDMFIRVEGGNGEGGSNPAQTRCAAIRCPNPTGETGVKAEQDCRAHREPFNILSYLQTR